MAGGNGVQLAFAAIGPLCTQAVLHCFTPARISEIVEHGRSHDIWDNSMAPILLLLHITAVGLILIGLFHAVGKERRAV